ncbi:MAG: hypothetical protein BZY88_02995 [SAR202 cluster bacterium Io17-Chloro-G9]|nr:MAG: hypothetical protein BZY88_02995 [SAR202 cluster bacterium Io17-Chloro-G9]
MIVFNAYNEQMRFWISAYKYFEPPFPFIDISPVHAPKAAFNQMLPQGRQIILFQLLEQIKSTEVVCRAISQVMSRANSQAILKCLWDDPVDSSCFYLRERTFGDGIYMHVMGWKLLQYIIEYIELKPGARDNAPSRPEHFQRGGIGSELVASWVDHGTIYPGLRRCAIHDHHPIGE